MTLRLIREAQIKSSLTAEDIRMLEVVKSALGKDSIASVMENVYSPAAEDYTTWLDVIQGYARDSGINIRKKGDFFDVAGAVLENDPNQPPYSMQEAIMKKLWMDSQAQKHMKKIAGLAQAAEDEERVAQAARTMVDPADDGMGDLGDDPEADMVADGSVDFDDQMDGVGDDAAYQDSVDRDMEPTSDTSDGEQAWWHDDEDDTDDAAFPKFAGRQGEDQLDDLSGVPEDDTFDPKASEYNNAFGTRPPPSFENEEKTAPKKQMSVLQQMLTLPKTSINTLVKDVESEGSAAWKQHAKPQNPHPKGSMAFKAWERGMTKAMKEQLGVNKEPTKQTAKKKR